MLRSIIVNELTTAGEVNVNAAVFNIIGAFVGIRLPVSSTCIWLKQICIGAGGSRFNSRP